MALSKVQIDNLKELYNNLQKDIEEASVIISEKRRTLKDIIVECGNWEKKILDHEKQFEDDHKRLLALNDHIKNRSLQIESDEKNALARLESVRISTAYENGLLDTVVSKRKNIEADLSSIAPRHAEAIEAFNVRQREINSSNVTISDLKQQILNLSREYNELIKSMDSSRTENRKELESSIAQKRSIESEIETRQRSLDSFEVNKKAKEEELEKRTYDLDVLEARLRIHLEKNKIPFKL